MSSITRSIKDLDSKSNKEEENNSKSIGNHEIQNETIITIEKHASTEQ
jgi:hypothetical protein